MLIRLYGSRFSKNRLAGGHQFLALPIIGTLGALTPIFVTSANMYLWGTFDWYMPNVIANFDSRAAKFFTAFSFMLATIGNQVAAGKQASFALKHPPQPATSQNRQPSHSPPLTGSYPFSNDITGIWPRYINIFRATIFISLFCIVATPWNIVKNAAGLLAFLSGYSCLMGPLAGVMVTDYYVIKRRRLDVHALYQDGPEGIYWYTGGVNLRAFVAFGVAVAPLLPGFAKSIDPDMDVGGAWKIYAFAWLFGFAVASTTYLGINWYVWPQTVSLVEEAVLPPQKGEVLGGEGGEAESVTVEGKDGSSKVVSEKEELDV